jgi:hypothetical protein
MKILLTGFTQRMTNSQKLRYDYLTSVYILRDALRRLGHEVDHRPVTPGEDLSGYDRALVGIGPTKSFTARFVPGSAWAYHQLPGRVILYCDDWSIEKTGYDFRNTLGRWEQWLGFFQTCGPVKGQELEGHDDRKVDVRLMLESISQNVQVKLLAPMFPWGDHAALMRGNLPSQLVPWDPTPLIPPIVHLRPWPKAQRWVMATLQKNSKVPKGQWPVHQVGNKRDGQAYLPEAEIHKLYGESWGVICPPYQKAGSGWWRYRYQATADARSVLWLSAADKAPMASCYQHSLPEYEKMDDLTLGATADAQHRWFYFNTATAERTLQTLAEALG